jgi:hypothetical protein
MRSEIKNSGKVAIKSQFDLLTPFRDDRAYQTTERTLLPTRSFNVSEGVETRLNTKENKRAIVAGHNFQLMMQGTLIVRK